MRQVTLRSVSDSQVRWVQAAFEVERTDEHVVLSVPVGSPGLIRGGAKGGPRGTFLLPDRWDDHLEPRAWRVLDVLMVHRFGQGWSTWRWLDDNREWTAGSYINLERDWVCAGDDLYDTEDLTLDLVVDAAGAITFKDEHELAWAEQQGYYPPEDAARIREIGQAAHVHFSSGGWPLNSDWDKWKPSPGLIPSLQTGWAAIDPDYRQPRPSLRGRLA